MTTITKNTTELATGDIITTNGMRLELLSRTARDDWDADRAAKLEAAGHAPVVVSFAAKVLNVEEVNAAGLVPFSWRCETRAQYKGTDFYTTDGDRWTVQGNGFATWAVETN